MHTCIFCDIIAGKIPANVVYQDDQLLAFHDISPAAPCHVLVIPKQHFDNLLDMGAQNGIFAHMMETIAKIATQLGLEENGFRLVVNTKEHGGQTVNHVHMHILGGRPLLWPPG